MAGTMEEVRRLDLEGVSTLGVTSGASTPERFFDEAVRFLRDAPGHVAIVMDAGGAFPAGRRGRRARDETSHGL